MDKLPALPTAPPKRTEVISIRLTSSERRMLDALARKLAVKPATLARHFVLHALANHSREG